MSSYHPQLVSQPWSRDIVTSAQTLSKLVQDTLVQTFTPDTSTSQWRVALKAEEVATDPGLASSAENVNSVFTSGIGVIVTNVQDFRGPVDSKTFANAAAVEINFLSMGLPQSGFSLQSVSYMSWVLRTEF